MKILIYGGGFNPPHLGHRAALKAGRKALCPDLTLVIPDGNPPHKPFPAHSPGSEERLKLSKLCFGTLAKTKVLDMAMRRDGPCYMVDTVTELREQYPGDELILLLGSDMLLSFHTWYRSEELMRQCTLAALCRGPGEREALLSKAEELEGRGARVILLDHEPVEISSSRLRQLLPERGGAEFLQDRVYREIIRCRLYGAKPDLDWLQQQMKELVKKKRQSHVLGCAETARMLAEHWGEDPDDAAEAGLLHDCSKRWKEEEQLAYCKKMGIELDEGERQNPQLLHARTGAVLARKLFGVPQPIEDAIRWHTTGKPDMNRLEKILYLADMIEPNRDFPGVEELRELAVQDLDRCMAHALKMSVRNIQERGLTVYKDTLDAYHWYSAAYGK